MEMLTAALAVLCALLTLVLLIQRPSIWPVLLALVVAWGICMTAFRYQLRRWLSRWVRGDNFEKSKTKFSLEQLSQPTALLSGETVLWYNEQFRARLLGGQDMLTSRVQKVLPGLDLQQCRTQQGQLLTLADGFWSVHSSTVPGGAECMTLLVLNEEGRRTYPPSGCGKSPARRTPAASRAGGGSRRTSPRQIGRAHV